MSYGPRFEDQPDLKSIMPPPAWSWSIQMEFGRDTKGQLLWPMRFRRHLPFVGFEIG